MKIIKTIITIVFALLIFSGYNPSAFAGEATFVVGSTSYIVNGQEYVMDAAPFIKDGRIFLPVRYLAFACGVTPENIFFENDKITLIKGTTVVQMTLGSKVLIINNTTLSMDTTPIIISDRTFLPARWVTQAFGYQVDWDEITQTMRVRTITYSVQEIISMVQPALVLIETNRGLGSGFFWSSDGQIITNAHVIAGASQIKVTTFYGKTYQGRIEKADPYIDLAIVRVNGDNFTFVPYYNTEVQQGEEVIAFGNPLGVRDTFSKGFISAPIKDISEIDPDKKGINVLQTDAIVLPGNSGGPLVNMRGEVVGVIFGGIPASPNLNFAIPISYYFMVANKPLYGLRDDLLMYLEEDRKWAKLHNEIMNTLNKIIPEALQRSNLTKAKALQNSALDLLQNLQVQVASYSPQFKEVDNLRLIYLEAINYYIKANDKLMQILEFPLLYNTSQYEINQLLQRANERLSQYNLKKNVLYKQYVVN